MIIKNKKKCNCPNSNIMYKYSYINFFIYLHFIKKDYDFNI